MGTYCPEYQHQPNQPYRLNSFRLEGLERVNAGYRLIQVDGLIDDDDFEKKIRQLSNLISGSVKMPTEPIRIDGEVRLAVVGQYEELKALRIADNYSLMPEVVSTSLEESIHPLSFKCKNNRIQAKLARKALDWAIDKALKPPEAGWWKYDRRFISREAAEHKSTTAIQGFPMKIEQGSI